jgi:hypothetical protein
MVLAVPHQTRGTAPSALVSCQQPANRSSARRGRTSTAGARRGYPVTIVSTGNCVPLRNCPNSACASMGGNQKPHPRYLARRRGSCGRPDPAAGTPAAALRPAHWASGSNGTATQTSIRRDEPLKSLTQHL